MPFTMACWFNSDDLTINQGLMFIGDKDVENHYFILRAAGVAAGDPIAAGARAGNGVQVAVTSTGYSANTWHHACGVFTGSTDRTAYIDGGSSGSNTGSATPAGADRTSIGQLRALTPIQPMSGRIAEAAIWNVALTAAEISVLADGFCPLFVRPSALQAYWPLVGRYSPEISIRGGFDLTVTGAVVGDHVRQIHKRARRVISRVAAAAGPSAGLRTLALTGVGI